VNAAAGHCPPVALLTDRTGCIPYIKTWAAAAMRALPGFAALTTTYRRTRAVLGLHWRLRLGQHRLGDRTTGILWPI